MIVNRYALRCASKSVYVPGFSELGVPAEKTSLISGRQRIFSSIVISGHPRKIADLSHFTEKEEKPIVRNPDAIHSLIIDLKLPL